MTHRGWALSLFALAFAAIASGQTQQYDDFNRANGAVGSNWFADSGTWTLVNNRLIQTNGLDNAVPAGWLILNVAADIYTDAAVQARLWRPTVDQRSIGLVLRYSNNAGAISYYVGWVRRLAGLPDEWRILRYTGTLGSGTFTELAIGASTFVDGSAVQFKIAAGTLTLSEFDGSTWVPRVTATDSLLSSGLTGLRANDTQAQFDDFFVSASGTNAGALLTPNRAVISNSFGALGVATGANSDCVHVDATAGPCSTGGGGTGGILTLNGLNYSTAPSQSFAFGNAGAIPGVVSVAQTHTFNLPWASNTGVVAGLVSNAAYVNFVSAVAPGAGIAHFAGGTQFLTSSQIVNNDIQNGTIAYTKLIGTDIVTVGAVGTGTWQATKIGLAYGGTNADLSATGGTSRVLIQNSVGAPITVAQLTCANLAGGCTGGSGGFDTILTGVNTTATTTWGAGASLIATAATRTAPMKAGTTLPGGCQTGDLFFKTDATAGQQIHQCNSGTWTQQLNSGSGASYSVIMDEGGALTSRGTVNFIGASIACVDNSGATRTDCTITAATPDLGLTVSKNGSAARLAAGKRRIGNNSFSLASFCEATPTAGTGRMFLYTARGGAFTIAWEAAITATLTTPSSCVTATVAAFPLTSMPAGFCDVNSGAIISSSDCTDLNVIGRDFTLAGFGLATTGDGPTLSVDTALITSFSSSTTVPGSCTSWGQVYFDTDAATGGKYFYCNGTTLTYEGVGAGSGASVSLDNLSAVSINTALLAQTGVDLGSTVKPFRDLYLFGGGTYGTNYFKFTGTPTAARAITFADVAGTPLVGATSTTPTQAWYATSTAGAGNYRATTAGDLPAALSSQTSINGLGITASAGGSLTIAAGKAFTANNSLTFTGTDGSSVALGTGGTVSYTIVSGTSALGTTAIASGACTTITTTATGTAGTDVVVAAFNADPTSTTGYIPSTNGMLTIVAWPTTNNVNFKVCNNTIASITPGASLTLNWRVAR